MMLFMHNLSESNNNQINFQLYFFWDMEFIGSDLISMKLIIL